MLYKKNNEKLLDEALFRNPTSEYRGAPFWAWNCRLEKDELLRQIGCLKEMGFGGFHMHSRAGMGTEYLSKNFFELIKACSDKAEKKNMLAWLYDEDRWPSGSAGGFVTKNPAYRQKHVCMTREILDIVSKEEGNKTGKPYMIACYDICLNSDETLKSYNMISPNDSADGEKWYAYVCTPNCSGWFNGQTYVDTLSNEAMQEFIKITYESYKNAVGDKFGDIIPSIFTDEPSMSSKSKKENKEEFPWTYDFADTYKNVYNDDIIPHLPELRWNLEGGTLSQARYRYHDHVCERFSHAFADQCGKWCEENGIHLTGHMLAESTLNSQTAVIGEAMRAYRSFGIPGIDMLCNDVELSTAKQTQSAVHQYGREGMLSELYGVTNWDFDFRGHKFQGDWQAALGVTVRVPHLSWVSMKGSAKRDYPASINYQVPWYKEYPYIENHFSRINTVLTRGVPVVKVGVIHPIESFWLRYSTDDHAFSARCDMESDFTAIIERMLFGTIDFDFICESLLPDLYDRNSDKMKVGKMEYSAIIVPQLITMRRTTLDILTQYKKHGGKLIFIGGCPTAVDGAESDDVCALFDDSIHFASASAALLEKLGDERDIKINVNGKVSDNLIYNMRNDNGIYYLFIAHGKKYDNPDISNPEKLKITLKGSYKVEILDTVTGNIYDADYESDGSLSTEIYATIYFSDSLLLRLTPSAERHCASDITQNVFTEFLDFKSAVDYMRTEPNVAVLDIAEWSLDGKSYNVREEILRIDKKLRKKFDLPYADGTDIQPWLDTDKTVTAHPYLKFTFESKLEALCELAFEEAEEVYLNGESVKIEKTGYYVDKSIHKMKLPKLKVGKNEIIVKAPIGKSISLENYFLLGEFDVSLSGCNITIIPSGSKLAFGSVTNQGMPFYGGNIIYNTEITTPKCNLRLRINKYKGALMRISVDGSDKGVLAFAPYTMNLKMSEGTHKVSITLFGSRVNTFGPLHDCNDKETWIGPNVWYTNDSSWSYEYCLKNVGILTSPVFEIIN